MDFNEFFQSAGIGSPQGTGPMLPAPNVDAARLLGIDMTNNKYVFSLPDWQVEENARLARWRAQELAAQQREPIAQSRLRRKSFRRSRL